MLSMYKANKGVVVVVVIKISQSWPRMCSRVHLNFAVVIFRFSSLLYFLAGFEISGQPCCCFWRFESCFFTTFRHYDSPFIVCSVITW